MISGQITDLIDIDYETLVLLLGVAGAGASWVLYQAILTKGRRAFRAEKQGETGEEGDMASLLSFIEYGRPPCLVSERVSCRFLWMTQC